MQNRVVVDASLFRAALEIAVNEKKTTLPILNNILLQPVAGALRLISTDLDDWAITDLDGLADNESKFLLPWRKVLDILKSESGVLTIAWTPTMETVKVAPKDGENPEDAEECKDENAVTIEVTRESKWGGWVTLEVGGTVYELPSVSSGTFPAIPEIEPPAFYIPGSELKATLTRIAMAISREESRYTLNGALMRVVHGVLTIVGTDGHRLAVQTSEHYDAPNGQTLVTLSAIAWLVKRVGKRDVAITIGESLNTFYVPEIQTTLISRKLTGQFPNYEACMPVKKELGLTASFPSADEFSKLLVKVARMADERSGAVRFTLNGSCVLSAESTGSGKARATVPARIDHDSEQEISIGFHAPYVLDFLKQAGKNSVILSLKDSKSSGLLECPEIPGYSYVIMPMRT
jgi:DNA polymerase III subunit beta